MSIWNQVRDAWRNWWPRQAAPASRIDSNSPVSESSILAAHDNLRSLIEDSSIPSAVRAELAEEFAEIEELSRKLREQEVHIAAFGRVGVGKSSLLNALLGRTAFTTSPLHGETRNEQRASWQSADASGKAAAEEPVRDGHLLLIDTPGIDELDGAERESLARRVSRRSDVVLLVCDADLTDLEFGALQELCRSGRVVLLVLNKADRYGAQEVEQLLQRLRERSTGLLPAENVIACSSDPRPETVIRVAADGTESETRRQRPADIEQLRARLWALLEHSGKELAALNASLFARDLDQQIASRIVAIRQTLAERVIRRYCLAKGVVVAANPVPVADLLAAAGTDVAMVIHLGEIYGFRLDRREASKLLLTISAQWLALMGAYWGMNLVSSALKTVSVGLSTILTASAQGALAWYATYLTGRMAQRWFAAGKSWGAAGPREVARDLLASLDRNELLRDSLREIRSRLSA